jgi:FG-GAP-like repeat/Bacterial pre-peptidase C-terminal domain
MNQAPSILGEPIASSPSLSTPPHLEAIWRNTLTNDIVWSQLSGSTVVASHVVTPPPPEWQLAATGDVNRDGNLDLLLRNQNTGTLLWWFLRGGEFSGSQLITPNIPDQNFKIVGTADINQDGNLDIIWQHPAIGAFAWYMPKPDANNSISYTGGRLIPTAPADWKFVTMGDVNQDKELDVLWTHPNTGSSLWWQMQQGQYAGASIVNDFPDPNQIITASADFNGDGSLDLVVQDVTLGTSDLRMMSKPDINGTISTASHSVVTPEFRLGQNLGWQIVGVAKMNAGNGLIDAGNTLATATSVPNSIFSRSQSIGGLNDPSDFYRFNVSGSGLFSANLTNLTADADLRVIFDQNNNGKIDSSEILAWPGERGTTPESLEVFLQPGSYFLEVRSYNNQLTNYQLATNFTAQAQAPTPKFKIQISFDATSEAQLDPATKTAIDAAKDFWEAQLSGGGSLVPGGILPIKITTEALKLKTGLPDNVTLAYSGPTIGSNDGKTLQIQSATTTINRLRLGTVTATGLKDLFIHEFSHNLGFGTLWDPLSFRKADGSIYQIGGVTADGSKLIDRTTNRYAANSNAGWAYGQLLRDAGATSIVPTAVPIEAGFAAHWDESVFQAESLTPVANSESQPISLLTLAALKDLGWKVNFGAADLSYRLPTTASAPSGIDFANLNRPPSASSLSV